MLLVYSFVYRFQRAARRWSSRRRGPRKKEDGQEKRETRVEFPLWRVRNAEGGKARESAPGRVGGGRPGLANIERLARGESKRRATHPRRACALAAKMEGSYPALALSIPFRPVPTLPAFPSPGPSALPPSIQVQYRVWRHLISPGDRPPPALPPRTLPPPHPRPRTTRHHPRSFCRIWRTITRLLAKTR